MSGLLAGRLASVSRRISRPPVREARFWIVQAMVVGLAAFHLAIDIVSATPSAVPAEMRVTGTEMRLDPGIELAAFRIAQEAVNNVIRHAGADQLLLTVAFGADGRLCLGVADDGRGFDPTALDRHLPAGRLGLLGMRERAALAGGQLTVRSAPGHGTIIEATFAGNGAADDRPPYSGTPRTPT